MPIMVKAVGATPMSIDWGEIYTSLDTGLADIVFTDGGGWIPDEVAPLPGPLGYKDLAANGFGRQSNCHECEKFEQIVSGGPRDIPENSPGSELLDKVLEEGLDKHLNR
jgi:hypothetical protein